MGCKHLEYFTLNEGRPPGDVERVGGGRKGEGDMRATANGKDSHILKQTTAYRLHRIVFLIFRIFVNNFVFLSAFLSVCLFSLNVRTAEGIKSNFFLATHMIYGRVFGQSKLKMSTNFVFKRCKLSKFHISFKLFFLLSYSISEVFFCIHLSKQKTSSSINGEED